MTSTDVLHHASQRSVGREALTHGLTGGQPDLRARRGSKRSASHPTHPDQIAPPTPHHEDAVIVHIGLNFASEPLALRAGRRRLCRAALHPLLLAPPVLGDPLQHQLPLLEVWHAQQGETGAPLSGRLVKQCDSATTDLLLLPPLCPGLLRDALPLLLFKVTLVLFDSRLDGWRLWRQTA